MLKSSYTEGNRSMSYDVKELAQRHQTIIRLSFAGMTGAAIAGQIGMTREAVAAVLSSPLAQQALARLNEKAEEAVVNLPARIRLQAELQGAGEDALRLNRSIIKDDQADLRIRARVATHFLDRVVFEYDETGEKEGSYRAILRGLNEIQRSLGRDVMLLPAVNEGGNGGNGPDTGVGGTPSTQE